MSWKSAQSGAAEMLEMIGVCVSMCVCMYVNVSMWVLNKNRIIIIHRIYHRDATIVSTTTAALLKGHSAEKHSSAT